MSSKSLFQWAIVFFVLMIPAFALGFAKEIVGVQIVSFSLMLLFGFCLVLALSKRV